MWLKLTSQSIRHTISVNNRVPLPLRRLSETGDEQLTLTERS